MTGVPNDLSAARRGSDTRLFNLSQAHLVQQRNDVAMGRHHFGADRDLDIRIGGVQLKQPRQNLIVLDKLPVEENRVAWRNADGDVILRDRSRRRTLGGQIYLIPFMWVWLRLTIMKLARRKNMMSMSGMISIRALFFGIGDEATRIIKTSFPG